ncbi:MAG TPA: hypothetical protein VHE30_05755 [Polyangiaceae bacterium]|nr:hypothetical protein [Polyangiaceae bacterium]
MNTERLPGAGTQEPEPTDANAEQPPGDASAEFDPYKFQSMSVSPTLRKELSAAKLERLGPEYFQDTVPPNRPLSTAEGAALPPPPAEKRRGAVAYVLAGVALVALAGASGLFRADPPGPRGDPVRPAAASPEKTPTPGVRAPTDVRLPEVSERVREVPAPPGSTSASTSRPIPPGERPSPRPRKSTPEARPRLPSATRAAATSSAPVPAATQGFWNEPR